MLKKLEPNLDVFMMALLRAGKTMPLGIPAWMLKERTHRDDHPMPPQTVLGLDNQPWDDACILGEYENKVGYQFSWGTIAEFDYVDEDETPNVVSLIFEISPEALLKKFPDPVILEDIFLTEYSRHPNMSDCLSDEAYGDNYTMALSVAGGKVDHDKFRAWMVECFIPIILPDLITAAEIALSEVEEAT